MEQGPPSILQELTEHLLSRGELPAQWTLESTTSFIKRKRYLVKIYWILKYMSDGDSVSIFGEKCPAFLYDLIISDEAFKIKVALDAKLVSLVSEGGLVKGSDVLITGIKVIVSPTTRDDFIVIITGLESIRRASESVLNEKLSFEDPNKKWINVFNSKSLYSPICAKRIYYISLYNDDVPFECDPAWQTPTLSRSVPETINKISIASIPSEYQRGKKPIKSPLLVRVIAKSKLNHYGKPRCSEDNIPWQFLLLLADYSGLVQAVLWDKLCFQLYYSVQVNDLLLINEYRIRSHVVDLTPGFEFELSINPSTTIIPLLSVDEKSLAPRDRSHLNIPGSLLEHIQSHYYSLEGLIVYIGPICCEANFPKADDDLQLSTTFNDSRKITEYRWVKLISEAEEVCEYSVKVYACSSSDALSKLAHGQYCTINYVKELTGKMNTKDKASSKLVNMGCYTTTYLSQFRSEPISIHPSINDVVFCSDGYMLEDCHLFTETMSSPSSLLRDVVIQSGLMELDEAVEMKTRGNVFKIDTLSIPDLKDFALEPLKKAHLGGVSPLVSKNEKYLKLFHTKQLNLKLMIGTMEKIYPFPMVRLVIHSGDENILLPIFAIPKLSNISLSLIASAEELNEVFIKELKTFLLSITDLQNMEMIKKQTFSFSLLLWKRNVHETYIFLRGMQSLF